MGSSPAKGLTDFQGEILRAFFQREQRFFLTGGAALVGFYFQHRRTDDLDLFTHEPVDLQLAGAALRDSDSQTALLPAL